MEDEKFQWKNKALAKCINEEDAEKELNKIEELYGTLTPKTIHDASIPVDALFHPILEWNDSIGGFHHRLQQIRSCIVNNIKYVKITNEGQKIIIDGYESVITPEGKRYVKYDVVRKNPDYSAQVVQAAMNTISIQRNKLSYYKQFEKIVKTLDKAIVQLSKV